MNRLVCLFAFLPGGRAANAKFDASSANGLLQRGDTAAFTVGDLTVGVDASSNSIFMPFIFTNDPVAGAGPPGPTSRQEKDLIMDFEFFHEWYSHPVFKLLGRNPHLHSAGGGYRRRITFHQMLKCSDNFVKCTFRL